MKMFLSLLAALTLVSSALAQAKVEIKQNVPYRTVDKDSLMLDIALPVKGDGPFPLVVCIHGGAWQTGNRAAHHRTIRLLAEQGFVAATIQYRLAPKAKYPAQLDDVRAAVRFLREKAKDFRIDDNKVAALGDSAGGHLSLLVGLMDPPGDEKVPSVVQAVVNFYGPTDFRAWKLPDLGEALLKGALKKDSTQILEDFLGTGDKKADIMATVSPITHIDKKDPPVLTFQGTVDPLVPVDQARLLHAALEKAGVMNQLEILEGASHGWGGEMRDRTDRITLEFLRKVLK